MEKNNKARKFNVIREYLNLPNVNDDFIIDLCLDEKIKRMKDEKEKSKMQG